MKKRYTLKNKKRFFLSVAFLIVCLVMIGYATKSYSYKEPEYRTITVKSGDTLWQIAREYNKGGDIRRYIYDIRNINNLEDCNIIEGTKLKIIIE